MSKQGKSDADKQEAIARLHDILMPGDNVYTFMRHVSRSGMQREISCAAFDRRVLDDDDDDRFTNNVVHGAIITIDYEVSTALGWRVGKHGGIVVGGTGMDMGFHLVYELGRVLWPDGTPEPHGKRNGQPDSEGGYALRRMWL